jgi:DNA mismatch endonuclease, patch repair protein
LERVLREKLQDGVFHGVSRERSRAMGRVRGKANRSTERRLRLAFVRAGLRGWALNRDDLQGRPDFCFVELRLLVFVDGCFWHGCPMCGHIPHTNRKFWAAKISRNRDRDQITSRRLRAKGYHVLRFWEHDLRDRLTDCVETICSLVNRDKGKCARPNGRRTGCVCIPSRSARASRRRPSRRRLRFF